MQEWILLGNSEHVIRESIESEFPDADPLQLITGVMNHFLQVATLKPEGLVTTYGWCLEATKETYRRLMDIGDYAGALKAIRQIKDLADQAAALYVSPDELTQTEPT